MRLLLPWKRDGETQWLPAHICGAVLEIIQPLVMEDLNFLGGVLNSKRTRDTVLNYKGGISSEYKASFFF